VLAFNPSRNRWEEFENWPAVARLTPFYLADGNALSRRPPSEGFDSYVSDPAKPVPFEPLPVKFADHATWATWLVTDQRFASTRTDVLSYQTPVLGESLELHGNPMADLFAKTTGTDVDFVVKVIDVYPPTYPEQPEMAGYELPITIDIFRGRYRKSFETPSPVPAGEIQEYKFRLPPVNYTVQPGHRVMVQIQSSLFPLYDRNPQTYVNNIFFAKTPDYQKATISLMRGTNSPSAVLLPAGPTDDNHDNGTR
jgi:putative CocE/NonD family hydrolase